jgi:hypothetical protein
MTAMLRRTPTIVLVLAGILALGAYYALLTRLAFAEQARRLLAVHFARIPDRASEALAIWLHNSRLVLGVTVWTAFTSMVRAVATDSRPSKTPIPVWVGDVLLGLWAFTIVLLTGVLLGAYGAAQAKAFWPYALVEIGAWALLIAVYVDARRRRAGAWRVLMGLATVELLLALAAVLEVGGLA